MPQPAGVGIERPPPARMVSRPALSQAGAAASDVTAMTRRRQIGAHGFAAIRA